MKTQEQKQAAWRPTQEDYEQKYKEALEIASRKHKIMVEQDSTLAAGLLEEIFPELAESEDERIRTTIIDCLNTATDIDYITLADRGKCLAWLEKQKEKPVEGEGLVDG